MKELIISDLASASSSMLHALSEFTDVSSASSSGWLGGGSFLEEPFVRICGEIHRLASVLPMVRRGDLDGDSRVKQIVASLVAAKLGARAQEVHPLLGSVLLQLDTQLRSTTSKEVSVGFLTSVPEIR